MNNNSVIRQTGKKENAKDKPSRTWGNLIGSGILGLVFLSSAISLLQSMAESFADDVEKAVFIDNWMSWLAILCFALGWFMTHSIEVALSKNQLGIAKLLFVVFLVTSFSISTYLHFFSNNDVLYRFKLAVIPLVFSGFFLRHSVFHQESILRLQQAIFGRLLD